MTTSVKKILFDTSALKALLIIWVLSIFCLSIIFTILDWPSSDYWHNLVWSLYQNIAAAPLFLTFYILKVSVDLITYFINGNRYPIVSSLLIAAIYLSFEPIFGELWRAIFIGFDNTDTSTIMISYHGQYFILMILLFTFFVGYYRYDLRKRRSN